MGCLFLIIAAISPRAGILLLWIFTNYVNAAFQGWVVPLLGLVFLPWTTMMYILIAAPVGGISFWGWLMVAIGFLMDISAHAQSYASRQQAMAFSPAGRPA